MAIKVLKPGLATTVQDLGRPGYYHIGIPLSGGMDRHALAAANLLVGNEEGAAVLEAEEARAGLAAQRPSAGHILVGSEPGGAEPIRRGARTSLAGWASMIRLASW